jgi:hypothetical protein
MVNIIKKEREIMVLEEKKHQAAMQAIKASKEKQDLIGADGQDSEQDEEVMAAQRLEEVEAYYAEQVARMQTKPKAKVQTVAGGARFEEETANE